MDQDELVEEACGKINLGLKVLGLRQDGYHEIRSIVQSVDLADVLHFRRASTTRLTCSDQALSTGADNLVLQAVSLFNSRLQRRPQSFHVHLEKNIPSGAGLGGGSADAAAVLRALNRFYGSPFDAAELRAMGAALGSDIPFLISGATALVRGRGERLQGLEWKGEVFYLLVYPAVEVSTAWAYQHVESGLTVESPYLNFIDSLSGGCVDCKALIRVLENDFQPLVERTYPIVADLSSYLVGLTGVQACSMSGSGSTVYGIFDDRNAAHQAHQRLQAEGYRSFLCQPTSKSATR